MGFVGEADGGRKDEEINDRGVLSPLPFTPRTGFPMETKCVSSAPEDQDPGTSVSKSAWKVRGEDVKIKVADKPAARLNEYVSEAWHLQASVESDLPAPPIICC